MSDVNPTRTRLLGQSFGKLKVISYLGPVPGHHLWDCLCECGVNKPIRENNLLSNHTTSCGCHAKAVRDAGANRRHSGYGTPEYNVWAKMISRCTYPKEKSYPAYGGRGISVCERWKSDFANFIADMGKRPSPNHSIERINVNGNYCPENCCWILTSLQCENTRTNIRATINGLTKNVSHWAKIYGVKAATIRDRLRKGWPLEKAIMTPPLKTRTKQMFTTL